jgi:phosphohistidine swiveling domain-containing protein
MFLSAVGQVVFDSGTAEDMAAAGTPVVLLRRETSPEDVKGMYSAQGVLTQLGGMTSHAAVVARGWGKPCITGCSALSFNEADRTVTLGGVTIAEGDMISLNGSTGQVILGAAEVALPQLKGDVQRFMAWVDEYRKLGVLANADTPADAEQVCLVRRQVQCRFIVGTLVYIIRPGNGMSSCIFQQILSKCGFLRSVGDIVAQFGGPLRHLLAPTANKQS